MHPGRTSATVNSMSETWAVPTWPSRPIRISGLGLLADAKKVPLALMADQASPMRRLPDGMWMVEVAR